MTREISKSQKSSLFASLKETLSLCFLRSPFYKNKFKKNKLSLKDFRNIDDLQKFPVTTREELLENNFDFLTCPIENVFRVFYTGGTTGNPKAIFLTQKDYYNVYTSSIPFFLTSTGFTKRKSAVCLIHYGIVPGGFAFGTKSVDKIGALSIPTGLNIDPQRLAYLLRSLKIKFILAAPPVINKYTGLLENLGLNLKKEFYIEKIITGGTGLTSAGRKAIEGKWRAKVFRQYGNCEGGNIGSECKFRDGYHIYPSPLGDPLYIEVLNPKTFELLPEGQEGIVAITTLKREAMPLIRYIGLRDFVKLSREKCKCGDPSSRIWIHGRESDVVNLRGFHKLYLYQIDWVLEKLRLSFDYRLIVKEKNNKDILILQLEIEKRKRSRALRQKLIKELVKCSESIQRGILDGDIEFSSIEFIDIGSLPRTTMGGKVETRLLDQRKVEYW